MGLGGIALGIPLALLLGRAARSLLFGISPADPATLGAVVLAVGTLTVLGTYLPSVRASRVDPITVLRSE